MTVKLLGAENSVILSEVSWLSQKIFRSRLVSRSDHSNDCLGDYASAKRATYILSQFHSGYYVPVNAFCVEFVVARQHLHLLTFVIILTTDRAAIFMLVQL